MDVVWQRKDHAPGDRFSALILALMLALAASVAGGYFSTRAYASSTTGPCLNMYATTYNRYSVAENTCYQSTAGSIVVHPLSDQSWIWDTNPNSLDHVNMTLWIRGSIYDCSRYLGGSCVNQWIEVGYFGGSMRTPDQNAAPQNVSCWYESDLNYWGLWAHCGVNIPPPYNSTNRLHIEYDGADTTDHWKAWVDSTMIQRSNGQGGVANGVMAGVEEEYHGFPNSSSPNYTPTVQFSQAQREDAADWIGPGGYVYLQNWNACSDTYVDTGSPYFEGMTSGTFATNFNAKIYGPSMPAPNPWPHDGHQPSGPPCYYTAWQ
jgi:hypothetical protein